MRKHERKKRSVNVGFIDLEKAYDRVNKEALWQGLRMYDVGGMKSMSIVNSLSCVRVKEDESEWFINSE